MNTNEYVTADIQKELGKEYFFHHNGDMEKRRAGIQMLIQAQKRGDPEAMYIVSRLILDSVLRPENKNPEEVALTLMCRSANNGWPQARAFLNAYCECRYDAHITSAGEPVVKQGPLVGFDGKEITIDRKGVLSPIDAVLEFTNGTNVLTLSTNVLFAYSDEIPNPQRFEAAVLEGLSLWQGEYDVFNGQKVVVQVHITTDSRLFDNLIVMPLTGTVSDTIQAASHAIGTKKRKAEVDNLLTSKRSFATAGLKWSVNSRKIICIQSPDGSFDDYEEIKHVAKHEFGHALGLGDLYACAEDSLLGVEKGTYTELDSYAIRDTYYNLVMCDHHGPISNNDVEMIILAFKENKMQLYQPSKLKGTISSALGRGN